MIQVKGFKVFITHLSNLLMVVCLFEFESWKHILIIIIFKYFYTNVVIKSPLRKSSNRKYLSLSSFGDGSHMIVGDPIIWVTTCVWAELLCKITCNSAVSNCEHLLIRLLQIMPLNPGILTRTFDYEKNKTLALAIHIPSEK